MAQENVDNGAATVEKSVVTFTAFKPQLIVESQKVSDAVTFYKSAFGAVETEHSLYPKRKADQEFPHVLSSEIQLAGSTFVVCEVSTDSGSPAKTEGSKVILHLETEDVEAAIEKSVAAGAEKVEKLSEAETDAGIKGKVTDPFGFTWIFSSPAKKTTETDENEEVLSTV